MAGEHKGKPQAVHLSEVFYYLCRVYKASVGDALVDELDSGEIVTALPDTLSTSICKSIMSIFNLIIEYGNVLYGTNLIHLSYKSIHSPATSTNNTNTINITDQQKLISTFLPSLIYISSVFYCACLWTSSW